MKIHTETLVIRLSPRLKQKLENDSWLRKMSMAEYLRAFIEKENAESGTRRNKNVGLDGQVGTD